jgi:putative membrane protein
MRTDAVSEERNREREYTMMMWGYGLLMMLGMTIWIVLLVVLIAVIVWAMLRWLNGRGTSPARGETHLPGQPLSAMDILEQRYARGEIDSATFERMREQLQNTARTPSQSR